jgi:hypothetical protein
MEKLSAIGRSAWARTRRGLRWRPVPRSLRRAATRLRDRYDRTTRTQLWTRRFRAAGGAALLDVRGALLFTLVIALIPPVLPVGLGLPLGSQDAKTFLQVLWQVEGAIVALIITIVLFVFQVFSSRSASSVHEFAEETGFYPIFYAGLSAVGVTGAVLLGYGVGGPSDWPGVWAATWSAVSLLLVAALFVAALQTIDVSRLKLRRIRSALKHVDVLVDRVILERISQQLLKNECESAGVVLAWFSEPDPKWAITAGRAGRVHDINLRILRRAGAEANEMLVEHPGVTVKLGDRVGADNACLYAPSVVRQRVPSLSRAITLRRGGATDEELRQTLDQIHEEALIAIGTPAPIRYGEIIEAYTDIVMRLPEAWARYGQQLERDIGVSSDIFGWTFLDTLRSNMYEEALHAVASYDRDIAQEILNFPLDVATRAIPASAFAIARTVLDTYAAYYQALLDSDNQHRKMLRSWMHSRLREYADFHIEPIITRDRSSLEERRRAEEPMGDAFASFGYLMKLTLDHDPRDLEAVSELNREWNQLLRHWDPELRPPDLWYVEHLEQERGSNDPEVRQLKEAANQKKQLVGIRDRLDRLRQVHRFGVCFWALRQYRRTQEQAWLEAFNALAGYFSSPAELTSTLAAAMQHEWDHRGPWSEWILRELPSGEAHGVSPEPEFIFTYLVLMIRNVSATDEPPDLSPDRRLALQFKVEAPVNAVERVLSDELTNAALPDLAEERAQKVVDALDAFVAAADRAEEDATMDATLSDTLIGEFEAMAKEQWPRRRFLRAAFANAGRVELVEGDPPPSAERKVASWETKGLFLEGEHRVHGHENTAREYVTGLLREESAEALRIMGAANPPEPPEAAPDAQLRRVIEEMRAAGLNPQLVLIPQEWRLIADLGLEGALGWGGQSEPPSWVPEDLRSRFRGVIEGMPVFALHSIPDDRYAVCDISAFGRWREWRAAQEPVLEIKTFDAEEARGRVESAEEDVADVESAVRGVRLAALISFRNASDIVVEDPNAVRWIGLAPR